MDRRVVVTGAGLVTPLGTGLQKTWDGLCAGRSGIGLISRFDTSEHTVKIAAEVKDFEVEDFIDKKAAKHLETFVQYAVASAIMARDDSGLEINAANAERVGVFTGNGIVSNIALSVRWVHTVDIVDTVEAGQWRGH